MKVRFAPTKGLPKITKPALTAGKKLLAMPTGLLPKKESKVDKISTIFTFTEKSVTCKLNDMSFSIRQNGINYENHSTMITEKSELQFVGLILSYIKKQVKEGATHEEICTALNTLCGTATTIRIIHSRIFPKPPVVRAILPEHFKLVRKIERGLSPARLTIALNKLNLSTPDYKSAVDYYKTLPIPKK